MAGIVSNSIEGTFQTIPFELKWSHTPVDLLYMWQSGNWNFGGGITYHINPKLTASGFFAGNDIGFDNNIFLGLEYAFVDYKVNTANIIQVKSKVF